MTPSGRTDRDLLLWALAAVLLVLLLAVGVVLLLDAVQIGGEGGETLSELSNS